MRSSNVAERFGLPRNAKEACCPDCGKIYGHHGTAVCLRCYKCTTCCRQKFMREHRLVTPDEFMTHRKTGNNR